jgi:AmiR/NasT family two-component response regulator
MDNLSISIASRFDVVEWAAVLVSMEAHVSVEDARDLIRTTAATTNTPVEDVAELVVNGTVEFDEP